MFCDDMSITCWWSNKQSDIKCKVAITLWGGKWKGGGCKRGKCKGGKRKVAISL